jgi:hypothetical protein
MPALGCGVETVRRVPVDHLNLFQTWLLRNRGPSMFVKWAPVPSEVKLLVNIDFLIPEDYDSALRDQKRQLILLLIRQSAQVDPKELCADRRRESDDF